MLNHICCSIFVATKCHLNHSGWHVTCPALVHWSRFCAVQGGSISVCPLSLVMSYSWSNCSSDHARDLVLWFIASLNWEELAVVCQHQVVIVFFRWQLFTSPICLIHSQCHGIRPFICQLWWSLPIFQSHLIINLLPDSHNLVVHSCSPLFTTVEKKWSHTIWNWRLL